MDDIQLGSVGRPEQIRAQLGMRGAEVIIISSERVSARPENEAESSCKKKNEIIIKDYNNIIGGASTEPWGRPKDPVTKVI